MAETYMLYSTFAHKDEAIFVADALVGERLVACANIIEHVTSIYHWEGKKRHEKEAVMMAKTSAAKLTAAMDRLKALHPYSLPCILAYPADHGFKPYIQWISQETGG